MTLGGTRFIKRRRLPLEYLEVGRMSTYSEPRAIYGRVTEIYLDDYGDAKELTVVFPSVWSSKEPQLEAPRQKRFLVNELPEHQRKGVVHINAVVCCMLREFPYGICDPEVASTV